MAVSHGLHGLLWHKARTACTNLFPNVSTCVYSCRSCETAMVHGCFLCHLGRRCDGHVTPPCLLNPPKPSNHMRKTLARAPRAPRSRVSKTNPGSVIQDVPCQSQGFGLRLPQRLKGSKRPHLHANEVRVVLNLHDDAWLDVLHATLPCRLVGVLRVTRTCACIPLNIKTTYCGPFRETLPPSFRLRNANMFYDH